jgi:dihydrofolate reductase
VRKLIVSMNVTLDGFMSGPDCELDWHFKYWNSEMEDELCTELAKADTIILGRITYNAMAKYWPLKLADPLCWGEGFAFANMMNNYKKIVFSRNYFLPEWNNSKLIKGNLKDEIRILKEMPGKNIIVYGSGKLVSTLIKANLPDEYQLWLHPVVLIKGKPLFKNPQGRFDLKLIGGKSFSSGVMLLHYQNVKKVLCC